MNFQLCFQQSILRLSAKHSGKRPVQSREAEEHRLQNISMGPTLVQELFHGRKKFDVFMTETIKLQVALTEAWFTHSTLGVLTTGLAGVSRYSWVCLWKLKFPPDALATFSRMASGSTSSSPRAFMVTWAPWMWSAQTSFYWIIAWLLWQILHSLFNFWTLGSHVLTIETSGWHHSPLGSWPWNSRG